MQQFIPLSRLRTAHSILVSRPPFQFNRYANMASDAPAAAETDTQASNVANESGITPESLSKTLKEKLEAKHVDIEDMSGTSPPSPSPYTSVLITDMEFSRRLRPSLPSSDCIAPIREEK